MTPFLILPHQLFDAKHLRSKSAYTYLLWEHPHYFTKYKYNKKKLVLHRASMKYYEAYLKRKGCSVQYCEFHKTPTYRAAHMFDPMDRVAIPNVEEVHETPACLLTRDHLAQYKAKRKDVYMFHWFLKFGKGVVDIIPDVKSKDKENRKKYPKTIEFPTLTLTLTLSIVNNGQIFKQQRLRHIRLGSWIMAFPTPNVLQLSDTPHQRAESTLQAVHTLYPERTPLRTLQRQLPKKSESGAIHRIHTEKSQHLFTMDVPLSRPRKHNAGERDPVYL